MKMTEHDPEWERDAERDAERRSGKLELLQRLGCEKPRMVGDEPERAEERIRE